MSKSETRHSHYDLAARAGELRQAVREAVELAEYGVLPDAIHEHLPVLENNLARCSLLRMQAQQLGRPRSRAGSFLVDARLHEQATRYLQRLEKHAAREPANSVTPTNTLIIEAYRDYRRALNSSGTDVVPLTYQEAAHLSPQYLSGDLLLSKCSRCKTIFMQSAEPVKVRKGLRCGSCFHCYEADSS